MAKHLNFTRNEKDHYHSNHIVGRLERRRQSFTVISKSGEKTGFNNSEVESIEFSMSSLNPAPVLHTIDFGSVMTGIEPAEGLVDITANPNGIAASPSVLTECS